ncbi:hypothetical protein HYX14_00135 [Candidatus Woesearchaeota archaeon]|nr:hypothetical protein [Candidatus Woesearchaeota archaeon]
MVKLLLFLLALPQVLAHAENAEGAVPLKTLALKVVIGASIIVALLVIISLTYVRRKTEREKWVLFLAMTVPIVFATVYSAGTTISLNVRSETAGPVHWHADFELWKCGQKINLRDPTGLTNRIGSPVFHEHGDDRIHVEGVVLDTKDISLHHFFEFIGGALNGKKMVIPTNAGFMVAENGELCDENPGKVQLFVYSISHEEAPVYTQKKFLNFDDYLLAPYSTVPPGDCVIIEFDVEKEKTDKLCATYRLAEQRGELGGG